MFEHQHTPQEETAPAYLPHEPNEPALLPRQAEAVLVGYLAQSHIEDAERDTVHTHLEELTRAYLELDLTPHEAATSAIRQWESERQVMGERQAISVQRQPHLSTRSVRPATLTALKLFGAGALTWAMIMPFLIGTDILSFWYFLVLFMAFVLPVLLGAAVGMRARQRPALGTLCALALLAPLIAIISEVATDLVSPIAQHGSFLGLWMLMFWLPVGGLTAGLTGWGRDLHRKRRRDAVNRLASTPQVVIAEPMP